MPSIGAKSDKAKEEEKEKSAIRDDKAPDYGATSESGSGSEEEGGGKGKKAKAKVKTRPISDLFRYATGWDRFLVVAGSLVSIVTGAGWPFMSTIFGGLSNTFIGAQNQYTNTGGFANGSRVVGVGMNGSSLVTTTALPEDFDLTMEAFQDKVIGFCLQYVYLACAILVAGYLQMACWITACERQIFKIRSEFFHAILRQNIGWYDEHQSGEMTTKLSDNLERVKEGIGDKFGLLIQYCAQFIAGFVIAFFYSWKLTLVMMSLTPLLALSGAFMSRMIASSSRKEQEKYAVAGAIAEEVFSCVRTVIAFNGQKQECRRYEKALESGKRDGILKSMYTGLGLGVTFMILFCAYALAFWYGSVLILSGEIERGTVFVVFFSVMMGSFALGNAAPQISVIATAKGSGTSLLDIIDRVPHIDPYSKEGLKLSDARGRIDFKNVRFNYPSRKKVNVLTGMNFSVEPGETVALVGASGCGKSTIVSLLLRYYDADSGTISIDGTPVEDLNVRWLRNLIGVVSQEPVLFDATLEENIKMGRENISYQEMVKAAKMANAHNFIVKLPDGYNTMVGERGTQLSGGQKQRIAIARALVRDPKILLLDEATSALDAESEGIVQEALDKAAQGRTTIIIAHRLSTIRNADKILAIELGEVKESGTHAELMKSQGLYHSLVTAQIFEEPASGYATGTDGATDAVKDEDGDSGTDADSTQRRRRLTKQKSHHSTSVRSGSQVSSVSMDFEAAKARRMSRLLSRVENEKERMRRELEEEGVKEGTLLQIMAWNKPEWLSITIGMLGAIVRGCVMPAFAFFYGEIFNAYSKEGDELKASAEFWSIMFIVIGVVQAISLLVSTYFFGVSGESLTMRLRLEAFKNLLRQDVGYFDHPRHSTGKLTTRLASDAPNIKAAVDFRLATVLSSAVSMVAGIVIAVIYGWQMALLTLALVPVIGLGGFLNVRIRTGNAAKDQKLLEDAGKVASEAIENPRTVQSLTRERSFHERFIRYLIPPHKHALKQAHVQAVSFAFAQSIFFFFYAACFRFGAYLIQENLIEPLGVYRVFFAIQFSGMTIGWATAYFPEFIKAKFASALIFGMIKTKPSIDSYSEAGMRPELSGALELEDVHFAYPTRPKAQVLKGLSVKLEQNKTLALVGQSGCGKSTVVSLLERFYDPLDGSVSVDTHDLRAVNIQHLRSNIALVSQEPVLFDCSIEDNIIYGLSGKSKTEVVEAAKKANIHDFISGLPQGYETRVGEKGTQLSGGQKQRVAIARALVRDPKILLLDEATSALDTESEKIVQEALDRAREGRTCIIIAHRLSTVQSADTIAVVSNGVVVEQGSHGELQAKKGAYYALTKKQNLNT